MRVKRCNLDLSKCDAYDTFKVRDVCDKLQQTGAMWSQYSTKIHPPLHCPLTMVIQYCLGICTQLLTIDRFSPQGQYKLVNGQSDYSVTSHLPIDGNRWITFMKLFEEPGPQAQAKDKSASSKSISKRVQIWCLDNDVRITLSKTAVRPQTRKHPTRGPPSVSQTVSSTTTK